MTEEVAVKPKRKPRTPEQLERYRENRRKVYAANKKKFQETRNSYYAQNKERILEERRVIASHNKGIDTPEKQRRRELNIQHRERNAAKAREWRKAHAEELKVKERARNLLRGDKVRENVRQRNSRLVSQGRCVNCCDPIIPGSKSFCELHWLANIATRNFSKGNGGIGKAQALKEILVKQDFKCTYTGVTLIPGVNASIDHKQPVSTHPELQDSLENIQWVSYTVNKMKTNLSEPEFFALCKLITERHESQKENKS